MSEAVSPLNGARFEGLVDIRAMGLQGMITLRGDLGDSALKAVVQDITGVAAPGQREIAAEGDTAAAWMSPDELMLFVPYADVRATLDRMNEALKGTHFLAVDVSDARAMFELSGEGLRDVIAKIAPVDMSADAFGPGQIRRTRLAQIPAAFWMTDDSTLRIVCFRSVAEYAFNLLKTAAAPGHAVGFHS